MEQITIRIKDKKKARTLLDFLKSLDFVESVASTNLSSSGGQPINDNDFFALAGLWAGRDVSLKTLREKA